MTEPDRDYIEWFEREALRLTRERLERMTTGPGSIYTVEDVRLRGSYPDTTIVIATKEGVIDDEEEFRLWDDRFWRDPDTASLLIAAWVDEG